MKQLIPSRMDYILSDEQINRFWDSVPQSDGCWQWAGNYWRTGYGRFSINRRYVAAHRVAYQLVIGTIPEGLWIDHLCRNRGCVNPTHLEPVTPGENQRRGYQAGRSKPGSPKGTRQGGALTNLAKTHCPQGHPYSGDNLYIWRNQRICKTCRKARQGVVC